MGTSGFEPASVGNSNFRKATFFKFFRKEKFLPSGKFFANLLLNNANFVWCIKNKVFDEVSGANCTARLCYAPNKRIPLMANNAILDATARYTKK